MSVTPCNARSKAWAWTSPTKTSPSSRRSNRNGRRNRPETNRKPRHGRRPSNRPRSPCRRSASHGTSWIRRSWRWPRTASPPGIPNSRGTSSWATRHGMSRPAATSRTGSSARPPPTRHCATSSTPSCETTTGRARKPRSRTVRRHPSQAGRRRQRSRNPRRPKPSRRDPQQQTQPRTNAPKPDGKAQKPKPIRSKKALLERFKTRLNENLAEQKNHMPPTQNRDRTPRKGR